MDDQKVDKNPWKNFGRLGGKDDDIEESERQASIVQDSLKHGKSLRNRLQQSKDKIDDSKESGKMSYDKSKQGVEEELKESEKQATMVMPSND